MDILLDPKGDLVISEKGDIIIANSVAQRIKIKLLWFAGEWKWNKDEGIPYIESLFVKNPDIDMLESLIRQKIFEVEEVTEVKEVAINFNKQTRNAVIKFIAITDYETIKEEVSLKCQTME